MLKRQQFCQMVLVSTAAVIGNLTKKTLAQDVLPVIYGVSAVNGGVILQSLDLTTDQVQDLSDRSPQAGIASPMMLKALNSTRARDRFEKLGANWKLCASSSLNRIEAQFAKLVAKN